MKPLSLLCSVAILVVAHSGIAAAVDYEANLSKIPPKDPPAENVPQILPEMRGVHPRLFFTAKDIEQLSQQIGQDPILKRTADELFASAKRFKYQVTGNPPPFVREDTPALATSNGQFPGFAYAYALQPTPELLTAIKNILTEMVEQPYWADTAELDSNMGAACNMLMVALFYDTVYNDLEPEFRAKVAAKILEQARRMFYLGFEQRSLMPIKYWQQDPFNNHRWYRVRGMAASLLAIADEKELETGYLLEQLKKQADFVMKWLPDDGASHEGAGYQQFGFRSILDAAIMMDRILGTKYLERPFFKSAWAQQLYYWVPGRNSNISFGDDMNAPLVFRYDDPPFFISPHLSRDKDVQAALKRRFLKMVVRKDGRPESYPWSLLAYYDPTVGEGDYKALPTHHLFPDLGAASLRDTWEDDAVIFTFKCGPLGGYDVNAYRHENLTPQGKPHYVNIAHDDPDANTFAMSIADGFIFHPGAYAVKKLTATNNGLTVNGQGQINEGQDYTQPLADGDMRDLSYLTGWKVGEKGQIIVEGEAGAAYPDKLLNRFRRTVIWMPGDYILLLDDIRANGAQEITWRGTVEKAQFIDPARGLCYAQSKSGQWTNFQILADQEFTGAIDYRFIDGRFSHQLANQFQFSAKTDGIRFVCLLDPWKKNPVVEMKKDGEVLRLVVKSDNFEDHWTYTPASDNKTPSSITGKRGNVALVSLGANDRPLVESWK